MGEGERREGKAASEAGPSSAGIGGWNATNRWGLVLIVGFGAAACGAGDRAVADTAWRAVTDTLGDTIVVRTVSGSIWGERTELVEEVRIGVFEGAEEYTLGMVAGIAAVPDGSVYILDRQVPVLRKYAPDGTYVATFGREGGGPGEYRDSDGVLRVARDYVPVEVEPAERDERERRIVAMMRATDPNWKWNASPIPSTKPPFHTVHVGAEVRLWVRLRTEAREVEVEEAKDGRRGGRLSPLRWHEPTVYDVFEPDGRYLGQVRAPEGFEGE